MAGGTEFRFVTDGIRSALEQATAAAGGLDIRLGGGVATIWQFLSAALIDELDLTVRPGYECVKFSAETPIGYAWARRGDRTLGRSGTASQRRISASILKGR